MPPELTEIADKVAIWLNVLLLCFIGSIAQLLHRTFIDEKEFSVGHAVATIFISFFVGLTVGSLLPAEFPARDGVLLMCGYCGIEIADFLRAWILKRAEEELGD